MRSDMMEKKKRVFQDFAFGNILLLYTRIIK